MTKEILIPITHKDNKQWVDARELHTKLGSKQKFADWIKNRINDYEFEQPFDYFINLGNNTGQRGKPQQNYCLSIDMAKELCMLERTDLGRKFRKYFILAEKQLTQILTLTKKQPVTIGDTDYYPYRKKIVKLGVSTGGNAYKRNKTYANHFIKINGVQYASAEILDYVGFNKEIYENSKVKRKFLALHKKPTLFPTTPQLF